MKAKIIIICCGLVVFITTILCAKFINKDKYTETTGIYIRADNNNQIIIVDDMPISMLDNSSDKHLFDSLETGDKIKISHDEIMETYPAQTYVYKIKLIEKGCLNEVRPETLKQLKKMGWMK